MENVLWLRESRPEIGSIGYEKAHIPRVAHKTREEYIRIMEELGLPLPAKIQEVLQINANETSVSYAGKVRSNPGLKRDRGTNRIGGWQILYCPYPSHPDIRQSTRHLQPSA